jgi:haloacid dehalogenase superfamily, subfamily IA, variant 3 with third motif having DD or ED
MDPIFWLLDLDGTLVDVETAYIHETVTTVGDRLGVGFTQRETEALWYGFGTARRDLLADRGVSSERFWQVFHNAEDPAARADATRLYADAGATVPQLNGPVGLVTHCQADITGPVLGRLDIRDWFDAVVCCDSQTGWKPDATPVTKAVDELGVPARDRRRGVLVGDDPNDIGAAWNAGLTGVHVRRRAPDQVGGCVRSDRQITSLTEL